MANDERCDPKRLPVLTLRLARVDGTLAFESNVHCDRRARSVSLETCRACERCTGVGSEPGSTWIECRPPSDDQADRAPTSVGRALRRGIAAIEEDVPLKDVVAMFVEQGIPLVVVVDSERHVVGVIRESDLLAEIRAMSDDDAAGRPLAWRIVGRSPASTAMTWIRTVPEATNLEDALREMAVAHERQILVVSTSEKPIGVLLDVDALLAYAAERRVRAT